MSYNILFGGPSGEVRANASETTTEGAGRSGTTSTVTDMAIVGLSNEQWLILRDMVNNHKIGMNERMTGKHDKIPWIIDTGASNHMTANLKCMTDLCEVVGCPMGLLDGRHTTATKEGSVKLSENLKLENGLTSRIDVDWCGSMKGWPLLFSGGTTSYGNKEWGRLT
ncbi:hypothetical protein KY285_004930 [Solanum tuberosum]|nr:hypothetical protein KY285_004930 [Solanum tuberosum]